MPFLIPQWNSQGVLPPICESDPTGFARSPYEVDLVDVIDRFGTSPERLRILDGFLRYREALHATGVTSGFQWIDGSFVEDVETIRASPPADIDLMSFYSLSAGDTQLAVLSRNPQLFSGDKASIFWRKSTFNTDAYLISIPPKDLSTFVRLCTYWYGLFSHWNIAKIGNSPQRVWKGFLQIDLSPAEDASARARLAEIQTGGMKP